MSSPELNKGHPIGCPFCYAKICALRS